MQAPHFTALDQDGQTWSLKQFKHKKKVILYFYPKDNSPFCTLQAKSLRDRYDELKEKDYVIFGINLDGPTSHKKFRKKHNLPFALLTDPLQKIHNQYQACSYTPLLGRTTKRITYVINQQGKITHIIKHIKTRTHAAQILATSTPNLKQFDTP